MGIGRPVRVARFVRLLEDQKLQLQDGRGRPLRAALGVFHRFFFFDVDSRRMCLVCGFFQPSSGPSNF